MYVDPKDIRWDLMKEDVVERLDLLKAFYESLDAEDLGKIHTDLVLPMIVRLADFCGRLLIEDTEGEPGKKTYVFRNEKDQKHTFRHWTFGEEKCEEK